MLLSDFKILIRKSKKKHSNIFEDIYGGVDATNIHWNILSVVRKGRKCFNYDFSFCVRHLGIYFLLFLHLFKIFIDFIIPINFAVYLNLSNSIIVSYHRLHLRFVKRLFARSWEHVPSNECTILNRRGDYCL